MIRIHSPSSIKTFLSCPKKYKYRFIDNLKTPYIHDISSYMGMLHHNFTERYYTERYNGKSYKIFTNEYISNILNSVPINTLSSHTIQEIEKAKQFMFSYIITKYLAKRPDNIPMTFEDKPFLETELKDIPVVHPITGEILENTVLQCRYDMIDKYDEIFEFKLVKHPFSFQRRENDLQITIQSYIFEKQFGRKPSNLTYEFMTKEPPSINRYHTHRTEIDYIRLFKLLKNINQIVDQDLCYPNYSMSCKYCGYYDTCKGE